jgi:hypothetical protein
MLFIDIFRLLVKLSIAIKCSGNKRRIPVIGLLFIGQQQEEQPEKYNWREEGYFLENVQK